MLSAIDLLNAVNLPPADAIAFLRSKGYVISWDWWEVWQEAQAKAFTVAKVSRLDVLEDIRSEVSAILTAGITEREFLARLTPRLQAKGWWGKKVVVDSQGNAEMILEGSPHRLKTIYRTNAQVAYNTGRHEQLKQITNARPYWQYVAVLDSRTRDTHQALSGRVFRADDPFWLSYYPPNGFNCRCRVRALSPQRLERNGLTVESSEGRIGTEMMEVGVNKRTGEVVERPTATFETTDRAGKPLTVRPDAGWSYSPGAAYTPPLDRYSPDLVEQYRRAQSERGNG